MSMHRPGISAAILCIALLAAFVAPIAPVRAEDNSAVDPAAPLFSPNQALSFDIPRLSEKIKVDGRLDDPAWQSARKLGNFAEVEPGDNVRPAVETEALVAYDDEYLYVAFRCYDNNPSAIRATITDRDRMFADDWVGVFIDTFRDQQNGYEFVVNPRGIQGDLRRSRNNEDSSYDAVWYSAGRLTDDGWTAEIALPFRSIRFPNAEVQSWGIHFFRTRPRESRTQLSWAPLSRDQNCFFCQAGVMGGIQGVNQGRNLEILPYVLASQEGASSSDDATFNWTTTMRMVMRRGAWYGDAEPHAGRHLQPRLQPDRTDDTDRRSARSRFSPGEALLLEGADMFTSLVDAVYTRSIRSPGRGQVHRQAGQEHDCGHGREGRGITLHRAVRGTEPRRGGRRHIFHHCALQTRRPDRIVHRTHGHRPARASRRRLQHDVWSRRPRPLQ
jgi:hypothetical protein